MGLPNKRRLLRFARNDRMEMVIFSWSGGKDSAIDLYEIQKSHRYEIVALLTTITKEL